MKRDRRHDHAFVTGGDLLSRSTAQGAKGIFVRFVLVALGINLVVGSSMIAFEVWSSVRATRESLETHAKMVFRVAESVRTSNPNSSVESVVSRAAELTGTPLALLAPDGSVLMATTPELEQAFPRVYQGEARPGTRFEIHEDFGEVSGAWMVRPFAGDRKLLIVVPHSREDEGVLEYMTISAGVLALGEAFTVLTMLLTANWILRRPLSTLVADLTSALARDVERRRRAEETAVAARLDAEAHLGFRNNLLDAADQMGIVATDPQGLIQIFNRAAQRILGYSDSETVGQMSLDDLRRQTRGPSANSTPLRSLMKLDSGEEFLTDKAGDEHLVAINQSDIVDAEGNASGCLVVFIDITQRKRLEAELHINELQLLQSAKLASLGEMATGVAHELSQPLNNIGLLASRMHKRLHDDALDPSFLREKLEKVQGQVQRASRIIDQLRAFGRHTVHQITSFRVEKPVHAVLDLLRQQLVDRGITVEVDIAPDLPHALADEAQLEQVLVNLINNARDALEDQTAGPDAQTIRISALATEPPDGEPELHLRVQDNGPGIPAEYVDRVFEPFFTTKEVGKGTGLGLSISYALVRGFGGRIDFESHQGQGTTFTIVMKTSIASPPKDPHEDAAANRPAD